MAAVVIGGIIRKLVVTHSHNGAHRAEGNSEWVIRSFGPYYRIRMLNMNILEK